MMMYRPTTNITANSTITPLTIQCAWSNSRGTSRLAATVDAAENPGIIPGIAGNGDSMYDAARSNHRCRTRQAVAWLTRVAIVTLWPTVHGCDTVDGGAVELSWKLRPASSLLTSKFVDCDSGQANAGAVTRIRLHWSVNGGDEVT